MLGKMCVINFQNYTLQKTERAWFRPLVVPVYGPSGEPTQIPSRLPASLP